MRLALSSLIQAPSSRDQLFLVHDRKKADEPDAFDPTVTSYGEFLTAYGFFNETLFNNVLPPCLITLARRRSTLGYFARNRFVHLSDGRIATDEIALNPMHFAECGATEVLSTLVHEQVHLWRFRCFLEPPCPGYHDKKWAAKMEEIGLMPTDTGRPGGKRTGQRVSHFIVEDGPFARAADVLIARGFRITWGDASSRPSSAQEGSGEQPGQPVLFGTRAKFVCPSCPAAAWGKPLLKLVCGNCLGPMPMHGSSSTASGT